MGKYKVGQIIHADSGRVVSWKEHGWNFIARITEVTPVFIEYEIIKGYNITKNVNSFGVNSYVCDSVKILGANEKVVMLLFGENNETKI